MQVRIDDVYLIKVLYPKADLPSEPPNYKVPRYEYFKRTHGLNGRLIFY